MPPTNLRRDTAIHPPLEKLNNRTGILAPGYEGAVTILWTASGHHLTGMARRPGHVSRDPVDSLASQDGLLATIGAAGVNRAAVPDRANLADHDDVRRAAAKAPQTRHWCGSCEIWCGHGSAFLGRSQNGRRSRFSEPRPFGHWRCKPYSGRHRSNFRDSPHVVWGNRKLGSILSTIRLQQAGRVVYQVVINALSDDNNKINNECFARPSSFEQRPPGVE
jgi:hypothetical protein